MKHLLDSDCVVDHLKGITRATAFVQTILPAGAAISVVTFTEVFEGVYGSRDPGQAEQIFRTFLAALTVLPYDQRIGLRTARLRATLRASKRPIAHRSLDLVIAATALEHELPLVTSNTRDYEDIPGLRLIDPREDGLSGPEAPPRSP